MKQTKRHSAHGLFAAILSLPIALLSSCSMMTDDRSDCPTCYNPVHLVLKYDYNTQRANMYADHVRQATVYITDQNGTVVAKDEATAARGMQMPNAFNFEGLPTGDYCAYAVTTTPAMPNMPTTTIHFDVPSLDLGDNIAQLKPVIPRSESGEVPATLPLDTLWMGHSTKPFHLENREPAVDTVSLVRDTKNLNIMLVQTTNPTDNSHHRYDVTITDENGRMDCDNNVLADQQLTYRPYAAWTTETLSDTTVIGRTAHFDLSFGRLISHEDATKNARLVIRNREDGTSIADLDLVHILSLARNAYNRTYPTQEYLDREYDYYLDFILVGNEWRELTIRINVLSWALRIQNEKL